MAEMYDSFNTSGKYGQNELTKMQGKYGMVPEVPSFESATQPQSDRYQFGQGFMEKSDAFARDAAGIDMKKLNSLDNKWGDGSLSNKEATIVGAGLEAATLVASGMGSMKSSKKDRVAKAGVEAKMAIQERLNEAELARQERISKEVADRHRALKESSQSFFSRQESLEMDIQEMLQSQAKEEISRARGMKATMDIAKKDAENFENTAGRY